MTARVNLTHRALKDLHDIGRYTLQTWGRAQRDTYLRALDSRFAWLAAHPQRGRARDDVAPGYRCYPQGGHVIFYLISEDGIDVIGIVHQARDVLSHFGGSVPGET